MFGLRRGWKLGSADDLLDQLVNKRGVLPYKNVNIFYISYKRTTDP